MALSDYRAAPPLSPGRLPRRRLVNDPMDGRVGAPAVGGV